MTPPSSILHKCFRGLEDRVIEIAAPRTLVLHHLLVGEVDLPDVGYALVVHSGGVLPTAARSEVAHLVGHPEDSRVVVRFVVDDLALASCEDEDA